MDARKCVVEVARCRGKRLNDKIEMMPWDFSYEHEIKCVPTVIMADILHNHIINHENNPGCCSNIA